MLLGIACTPASGKHAGVPAAPLASAAPSAPAPAPAPAASAPPPAEPAPSAAPPAAECAPIQKAPGWDECEPKEVTGAPPCEAICRRARRPAAASRCCEAPLEVAVLGESAVLLRLNACGFVPPDCAHVHGHGNMDARLRVLPGPPPELVFVEGGCEARALAHGYVPPGVAAWSGCRHQRFRWDGKSLAKVIAEP